MVTTLRQNVHHVVPGSARCQLAAPIATSETALGVDGQEARRRTAGATLVPIPSSTNIIRRDRSPRIPGRCSRCAVFIPYHHRAYGLHLTRHYHRAASSLWRLAHILHTTPLRSPGKNGGRLRAWRTQWRRQQ